MKICKYLWNESTFSIANSSVPPCSSHPVRLVIAGVFSLGLSFWILSVLGLSLGGRIRKSLGGIWGFPDIFGEIPKLGFEGAFHGKSPSFRWMMTRAIPISGNANLNALISNFTVICDRRTVQNRDWPAPILGAGGCHWRSPLGMGFVCPWEMQMDHMVLVSKS